LHLCYYYLLFKAASLDGSRPLRDFLVIILYASLENKSPVATSDLCAYQGSWTQARGAQVSRINYWAAAALCYGRTGPI